MWQSSTNKNVCDFEKSTKQIHKSADSKHHGHLTLKETTKVKSAITEIRNFGMVIMYDTHELKNLHISAMVYYINTLDGERPGHGRCEPKYFKDGDLF